MENAIRFGNARDGDGLHGFAVDRLRIGSKWVPFGLCALIALLASGCIPAIHSAAARGDTDKVRRLLDSGTPVDKLDIAKQTPLMYALGGAHVFSPPQEDVALLLLDRGADPDFVGLASARGSVALVESLLAHGADVRRRDLAGGTALHRACSAGNEAVVRLLLAKGADVNARTTLGITPLHRAAASGRASVVRMLLDAGAEVDAATKDMGYTPLHMAIARPVAEPDFDWLPVLTLPQLLAWNVKWCPMGVSDVVEVLLERGADSMAVCKSHTGESNLTPLLLATRTPLYRPLKRLLLAHGADPEYRGASGRTMDELAAAFDGTPMAPGMPTVLSERFASVSAGVVTCSETDGPTIMMQYVVLWSPSPLPNGAWMDATFDALGSDGGRVRIEGHIVHNMSDEQTVTTESDGSGNAQRGTYYLIQTSPQTAVTIARRRTAIEIDVWRDASRQEKLAHHYQEVNVELEVKPTKRERSPEAARQRTQIMRVRNHDFIAPHYFARPSVVYYRPAAQTRTGTVGAGTVSDTTLHMGSLATPASSNAR